MSQVHAPNYTQPSDIHQVNSLGSMHKYRTEIPNIVGDLGLDPYEYRIYVEYKRIAGDSGGCYKSNGNLAKECGMGLTKLKEAKKKLASPFELLGGKPLIYITSRTSDRGDPDTCLIELTDIWEENFLYFIKGPTIINKQANQKNSIRGSCAELKVGPQTTMGRPPNDYKEDPPKKNLKKQQQRVCEPILSNPKPAPTTVVVPPCLNDLAITPDLKQELAEAYKEEPQRIEAACKSVTSMKNPRCIGATLRSALAKSYTVDDTSEELTEKNVKFWDNACKRYEGNEIAGYRVDRSATYVQFCSSGQSEDPSFKFDEHNFQEKVNGMFKKLFQAKADKRRNE